MQRIIFSYTHKDYKKKGEVLNLILLNAYFSAPAPKRWQPGAYSSLRCALWITAKFILPTHPDHNLQTKTWRQLQSNCNKLKGGEERGWEILITKSSLSQRPHLNHSLALKTVNIIRMNVLIPIANMFHREILVYFLLKVFVWQIPWYLSQRTDAYLFGGGSTETWLDIVMCNILNTQLMLEVIKIAPCL